jgi:hypothetical protein
LLHTEHTQADGRRSREEGALTVREEKSCFNCKHAAICEEDPGCWSLPNGDPGWPGEPAHLEECKCLEVPQELFDADDWDEESLPDKCGHYDPIMVEKCVKCDKPINQPRYSWEWWAAGYDSQPVCSKECKDKWEREFAEQMGLDPETWEKRGEAR